MYLGITPSGSIYLWVVWVSPLAGKGDTQVSQPLMVSWVCPRTPVSFPGYTARYNTPRYYVYLGRPLYMASILGYTSVYNAPKYSASSMVLLIDLSAQLLVLGILLSVTPLEILALL